MPRPRSIARRYALQICALAAALLIASGLIEMTFSFREARADVARLQAIQAGAAAREIEQYLGNIEAGLANLAQLPWGSAGFDLQREREELHRLMVLFPAVADLRSIDAAGGERVFASRTELDRLGSAAAVAASEAAGTTGYGAVFFRDGSEPYVQITVPGWADGALTRASIHLRFLADVVSGLRVGAGGRSYVVDATDRLVAHPRQTHVLRRLDLAAQPIVAAARLAQRESQALPRAIDAVDLDGAPVIASAAGLLATGWLLVVEIPRAEALAPAYATLTRTLILIALGGALAVAAGVLHARRLAAPIVALRRAAGTIAEGDLGARIELATGDELEQLAGDFNRMAQRVQESYRDLEAKVVERTAALSSARDAAERANAAKTRFLAAASHDLRQPMHTIALLVGVLGERLRGRDPDGLADKVRASAATMENLFGSLLDISRLDAGAIQPRVETFAIDDLLRHLALVYAPQAGERGLELRMRRCGARVRSDPALLERIVANLVSNALRYTHRGGVLVGCRRRAGAIAIQVWDTGAGIAPEHHAEIFEEFVRLDVAAGSGGERGLGLGLSIVKRSADILGHALALRSRPGRGSMFEVVAPEGAAPAFDADTDASAYSGALALAGLFVVIVDDDADNLDALRSQFEQWGVAIVAGTDADAASAALAEHLRAPDLIVSDYRLHDRPAAAATIEQLRDAVGERIPALILTADVSDEVRHSAAACGARVLTKPASAVRLRQAIEEALAERGSAA